MSTPVVVQLPASNDVPSYKFRVALSGSLFTLRLRYNTRMARWILDVADSQNNDILVGVPLLINYNLTGRFVIPGLPQGFVFCTDDTNQQTQPTRYAFGVDHSLFYLDPVGG